MRKILSVGVVAATAGALSLGAMPAHADIAPTAGDVVGVGSDTVQNVLNFVADGRAGYTPSGGSAVPTANGYNFAGNKNRLISFDATPDENDRTGYLNGSTSSKLLPLNPTIILRAGLNPVQRPNGSGAGIKALLADTTAPYKISYVRMSRPPTATEQSNADKAGFGPATGKGLRVVQLSNDILNVATNPTTNDPTSGGAIEGFSTAELQHIYSCDIGAGAHTPTDYTHWDGALGGSSADTIVPEIPQAGSGTRNTFLTDVLGSSTASVGSCVQTVEENDPSSLNPSAGSTTTNSYGLTADEIVPFSGGRKSLFDSGYFHDPSVANGGGAALTSNVVLPSGTPADAGTLYTDNRGLFVVFRENDAESTTPYQPGGSKNWAQTLFIPGTISAPGGSAQPYVATGAGVNDINDAGVTANYSDLGAGYSVN